MNISCLSAEEGRSTAIYSYDRCLTFEREVATIWRGSRISIVTGLYVLLHLAQAIYQLLSVVFNFMTGCEVSLLPFQTSDSRRSYAEPDPVMFIEVQRFLHSSRFEPMLMLQR